MNLSALLVCAISQVLDPAPAPVVTPPAPVIYEWIGLDGSVREGALLSIEKGVARIRESRGGESSLPLSSIASAWRISAASRASVIPSAESVEGEEVPATTTPPVWMLQLTDGQRLRGEVVDPGASDSVTLALPAKTLAPDATTNAVTLPLERLSRAWSGPLWPRSAQRVVGDSSRDVLWLVNGDVISGFVSEFGKVIKIENQGSSSTATPANGPKVQEIPLASVAAISLTNPDVPASGVVAGWDDGSITVLAALAVKDHACRAVLAAAPEVMQQHPLNALAFMVPDASRWRSLRADGVGPSGAQVTNAQGVLLAEPGTYSWPVKPGESHFVAQVSLPASSFDWGDCTLIVRLIGAKSSAPQEAARIHIDAESPRHQLSIALGGSTASAIEFTIDPGPSGPVQDRLQFSRAGFIASPRK